MSAPSPLPSCRPSWRRRALLGGVTVPVVLLTSLFGAGAAFASPAGVDSKAALGTAFLQAADGDVVTLGQSLTGDGGAADVLTVPEGVQVTLDLQGHELDLDRIVIEDGGSLDVRNDGGARGRLLVGTASVTGSEPWATGVQVEGDASLTIGADVDVVAAGSDGRAGIGTTATTRSGPASLTVLDDASVEATGGRHAAGIGGGERAAPLAVEIRSARVVATGGAGGAGIGGGYGSTARDSVLIAGTSDSDSRSSVVATGGAGAAGIGGGLADPDVGGGVGSSVTIDDADVTAADGGTTADRIAGWTAPSAIGAGQGTAPDFGTLGLTRSSLDIPAGAVLDVPAGIVVESSTSTIAARGTLTGAGVIRNRSGAIRAEGGGRIDDSRLRIIGTAFTLALRTAGGTTDAPQSVRVYANTLRDGGISLDGYTGTSGDLSLLGWTVTDLARPWWYLPFPLSNGGMLSTPLLISAPVTRPILPTTYLPSFMDEGSIAVTAAYGHPVVFSGTTLQRAVLGEQYDQALPVTGDVTSYDVSVRPLDQEESPISLESDESLLQVMALDAPSPATSPSPVTSPSPSPSASAPSSVDPAPDAAGIGDATIPYLPVGLAFDSGTARISGTPTVPGHYVFAVTAYSTFRTVTQQITLDVAGPPTVATTSLPGATSGTAYSVPVLATSAGVGGTLRYTADGALPEGLRLDATTGVLSGTPTVDGAFAFGVTATNDFGATRVSLRLAVAAAAVVRVDPVPVPEVSVTPLPSTPVATPAVPSAAAPSPSVSTPSVRISATPAATPSAAPAPVVTAQPQPVAAPAAPVLPVVPVSTVRIGHPLTLSVAASSTERVTYAVTKGRLPGGLALDARSGLITGAPADSGRFVFRVAATSSAGSTSRAYTVVVPEATQAVTAGVDAVAPVAGRSVEVSVGGLLVGERWRVRLDGTQVATGIARTAGVVTVGVRLPRATRDTAHVVAVSGDRADTDPSILTSDEVEVTAVARTKRLSLTRFGSIFSVEGLAAGEKVVLRRGTTVVATGRADAHGVFTSAPVRIGGAGTWTATGATRTRTDRLTVG